MLWEATDWYKMDLYAVEVNLFVDTILSCIFRYASNRPITLCSFSPEVCIILALKQARYPILFGNDSGNYPTGDVRASNLQEAVHFSNRWNLDGLALASEPLVMAPKLIGKIKSHNLVCVSYGELNDDPQKAKVCVHGVGISRVFDPSMNGWFLARL
jgi:glycerophosphoryl diester phosphodiesterase